LYKLSEDILDIARIESNSLTLNKSTFHLGDMLEVLVKDCRRQIEMDGRHVNVILKPSDVEICADKGRIMQVLGNLLSNALKFTEHGAIILVVKADRNRVLITVSDAGPGIDKELLPRLLTKFATKSDHGTGLGLFISRSIIEAHGGKIWAENNKDGKGATFGFSLPLN